MIHAFALEPALVATWGQRQEFRFIHDKFGHGTPRVLLELPVFSKWKKAVYDAAIKLQLSEEDIKRIEELFRLFSEHKVRREDAIYDGVLSWLENAEREFDRRPFAAIIAGQNPRRHRGVLIYDQLGVGSPRWVCEVGASPPRTAEALANALSPMLMNCKQLHLIDPHFGPENRRHRDVLEALINVLAGDWLPPEVVRVHCLEKSALAFFESEAAKMTGRLPTGVTIEFVRWRQKNGGEKLHKRYVLTDIGGVMLGDGLDTGKPGETDDLSLLTRAQYDLRWSQYVGAVGAFECVDRPSKITGTLTQRSPTRRT